MRAPPERTAAATKLAPLAMKFRPPYAVIGPRLYFVAEDEGMSGPNNGTVFLRRLVALDGASGRVSWLHPLTAGSSPRPRRARADQPRRRQAGARRARPAAMRAGE